MHTALNYVLIYLASDFKMKINPAKLNRLKALNLVGGLEYFSLYLDKEIFLPHSAQQRPAIEYIRRANALRGTPG